MIDSGSLEQYFQLSAGMKLQWNGQSWDGTIWVGVTPANNFFGHGVFPVSPWNFFRVFTKANGFEL